MIVTSTLRMQLDAAGFVKSAAQLAQAVEQDVKRLAELKAALKDTGGTERLQASLQKFGASAQHIEGVKRALESSRQELGITGKAWADLTADQKKALRSVESTAVAVVRSEIAEEKRLTTELAKQAETRTADLKREAERAADTKARMLRDAERQAKREQEILANIRRQEERDTTRRAELAARDAKRQADEEIRDAKRAADARIREAARAEAAEHRARERELADQRRHEEAMRHAQDRGSFRHMVANGVAGYVSAHGVVSGGERVLEKGAELQHERVQMGNAGISAAEIVRIQDQALRLSTIVGNISQTGVMETAKELRSIIADPHELEKVLDPIIRAKSVIDGMDTTGASSQGLAQLLKAAELVGAGKDPERITKLIDGWVKVMQVSGKTVNPEQIFEFVKYSKTAGATLSDRFLTTVGPSILQELGGSTTGNDIAMMSKTIATGFGKNHSAMREAARIGLINPGDIEYLKTGEAKGLKRGTEHAVAGDRLFQTDPDKWVYEVLIPLMEKAGIKAQEDQLSFVQRTFTGTSADFIAKTITQRQAYDTHGENYGAALGLKAVGENAKDAVVGLKSFTTALGNLEANISGPAMDTIGRSLNGLASWINSAAEIAKEHPVAAPVIGGTVGATALAGSGYLSWKAITGFGMTAAKTQVTAAEMQLAAAEKNAGGTEKNAATNTKGGGILDALGKAFLLYQAIQLAKDVHAIDTPKRGGVAGAVEFLDPGLADRIFGRNLPESRTKDDVYAAPRTSTLSAESYWDRKKAYLNRGFADGGFTGPGSRNEPAGIVHRGEYVVPASATTRHRALLDAIRRGDILPGYAQGGLVGGTGGVARVVLATDSSSTTALREVFGGAVYDALRRIRSEDGSLAGGSGESGEAGSGGARSLRYGRGGDGTYRSTPGHHGVGAPGGTVRGGGDISSPSADSGRATRAGGNLARNQQEAYRAARAEGLSDVAARALVANMSGESLAKPNDYHYDRTHMSGGIVQWDPAHSARIKEHFGKLPWQMSVTDQTRAAVWEMRTRPEYAATNRALPGTDPNAMIGTLVDNYERPQLRGKAKRERLGYLHGFKPDVGGTYADEGRRGFATGQREAERAVLPRRSEAVPEVHSEAGAAGVNLKVAGLDELREAHQHVDALHQKLAGLAGVNIAVKHNMHETTRPGALRTALNGGYVSDGRSWT